ncbi:hypothetical protein [Xanthomonas sp. D-109]|nr:hypothetical protein [Xanthomonas sp. D-109]MBO9880583.1 hypothetical protein [Xanthomonas sp. D-109]
MPPAQHRAACVAGRSMQRQRGMSIVNRYAWPAAAQKKRAGKPTRFRN